MRPRPLARRLAMQYLFAHDLTGGDCEPPEAFLREHADRDEGVAFGAELVDAVLRQRDAVDEILRANAANFALERMAAVDRNVLRLAVAELLRGETPFRVVIDEAVELAKKFGGADSPRFVNGILDAVARKGVGP